MNDIIITRVKNGWVVRIHAPHYCSAVSDQNECSVFNTIEALTAALPDLLKTHYPSQAAYPLHSIDPAEMR